ncbi:hypothetical protein [Pantoea cypripedii]|uniref:hypothetical protein n=1 Tax=Pantoea cypripedii TaxID=55209 RepID=UPI00111BD876|nr:hypothetical protein [Pantoea cypripedii]MBP2195143.1 hypothetical protein [Pantoea cypripedii]
MHITSTTTANASASTPAVTRSSQLTARTAQVQQSALRPSLSRVRKHYPRNGNADLKALQAQIQAHWPTLPRKGSKVSQMEKLLFRLVDLQVLDIQTITAKQLISVLHACKINIKITTVITALSTLRAEVSPQNQQWFNAHWQKVSHKIGKTKLALAQLVEVLREEGCPEMTPSEMRRALLNIGEDICIATLCHALALLHTSVTAEQVERVKTLWQQVADGNSHKMDQLITLILLLDYQRRPMTSVELKMALARAEIAISDDMIRNAQAIARTQVTPQQQAWFDTHWSTTFGDTWGDILENLLHRQGRPVLTPPQLWLLLVNAKVKVSFSAVRHAMSADRAVHNATLTAQQIQSILDRWQALAATGSMTQVRRLGTLLLEGIAPGELKLALRSAGISASHVAMGLAMAAVNTTITPDLVTWFKTRWATLSHPPQVSVQGRLIMLLRQPECPPDLTQSKLQRLLWEVDVDVCISTLTHILRAAGRHPAGGMLAASIEPGKDTQLEAVLEMALDMAQDYLPASERQQETD